MPDILNENQFKPDSLIKKDLHLETEISLNNLLDMYFKNNHVVIMLLIAEIIDYNNSCKKAR